MRKRVKDDFRDQRHVYPRCETPVAEARHPDCDLEGGGKGAAQLDHLSPPLPFQGEKGGAGEVPQGNRPRK